MNTANYNNLGSITDPTYVGVDGNRLVVTSRPADYGTFAVTTAENYTMIPYHKARSFRISNYTGKMIGIRRRHKTILVDDFNDQNYPEWLGAGVIAAGEDIEGSYGAEINGLKYRPLTTEVMLDGSEVEVTFKTPGTSEYSVKVSVWDDPSRIGAGNPAATFEATQSNTQRSTVHRVVFRLRPTSSEYDAFLESPTRATITSAGSGEFGTNNMQASIVSIETTKDTVVDPLVYQQKVNWSPEHMGNPSSFTFPCEDNISEYEVINLGSDKMNYSDNTDSVSLSGFYAI